MLTKHVQPNGVPVKNVQTRLEHDVSTMLKNMAEKYKLRIQVLVNCREICRNSLSRLPSLEDV